MMFDVMFYLENLLAAKKVNHTVIIIFATCIYFSRCTLHQAIKLPLIFVNSLFAGVL